jgi:hypothetical protein
VTRSVYKEVGNLRQPPGLSGDTAKASKALAASQGEKETCRFTPGVPATVAKSVILLQSRLSCLPVSPNAHSVHRGRSGA